MPYKSSVIMIGSIPLGGDNPVRLQSMTNTDTLDTKASVAQCIRIIEAGADFVRLTAQGVREAQNLAAIREGLRKAGFETPLIADIHFNPAAAETAAGIVEKVRINPGNYTDKRASFEFRELTETEYNEELERTHAKLLPLINICKENNTAIRVGINHGSLSDRIMTRYGNTSDGMVFSALEFITIFRKENFNNLVLSMKSSDTSVMIEATRMLVKKMQEQNISYPLHLGVTEAGEGEDGRIRSAAGIGALLSDGIGDTIRVSLSEDPEKEIPVAKKIIQFYPRGVIAPQSKKMLGYAASQEKPAVFKNVNGPVVIANALIAPEFTSETFIVAGFRHDHNTGNISRTDASADLILASDAPEVIPAEALLAVPYEIWRTRRDHQNLIPIFSHESIKENTESSEKLNIVMAGKDDLQVDFEGDHSKILIVYTFEPEKELFSPFNYINSLKEDARPNIILNPVFHENRLEDLQIKAAALLGRYITDKMVSGISLTNYGNVDPVELIKTCFSILQCTGKRITRTVFLSCPTCGRTKFNLQESVKKVKAATGHLKGLKIAVMGCIVNGPGEMAGADYGYVGAANGKVHIYRGTEAILKNIPESNAAEELLKLIESDRL